MDGSTIHNMTTSDKSEYGTPDNIFRVFDDVFHFELDVCATPQNTKVLGNYYTKEDDALDESRIWRGPFWMNPPYGKGAEVCNPGCQKITCQRRGNHITKRIPPLLEWVVKAQKSCEDGDIGVCLLPGGTETNWFQVAWTHAPIIVFLRKRIKFIGGDSTSLHPSVVAIFGDVEPWELTAGAFRKVGNVVVNLPPEGGIQDYKVS